MSEADSTSSPSSPPPRTPGRSDSPSPSEEDFFGEDANVSPAETKVGDGSVDGSNKVTVEEKQEDLDGKEILKVASSVLDAVITAEDNKGDQGEKKDAKENSEVQMNKQSPEPNLLPSGGLGNFVPVDNAEGDKVVEEEKAAMAKDSIDEADKANENDSAIKDEKGDEDDELNPANSATIRLEESEEVKWLTYSLDDNEKENQPDDAHVESMSVVEEVSIVTVPVEVFSESLRSSIERDVDVIDDGQMDGQDQGPKQGPKPELAQKAKDLEKVAEDDRDTDEETVIEGNLTPKAHNKEGKQQAMEVEGLSCQEDIPNSPNFEALLCKQAKVGHDNEGEDEARPDSDAKLDSNEGDVKEDRNLDDAALDPNEGKIKASRALDDDELEEGEILFTDKAKQFKKQKVEKAMTLCEEVNKRKKTPELIVISSDDEEGDKEGEEEGDEEGDETEVEGDEEEDEA